ncbi:hypothetical protein CUMW_129840 [Citrus unshiu]|nr:hypothetical protein CUMW_129840 [Citrus unshiu]
MYSHFTVKPPRPRRLRYLGNFEVLIQLLLIDSQEKEIWPSNHLNRRLPWRMIILMKRWMLMSLRGGCGRTKCVSNG